MSKAPKVLPALPVRAPDAADHAYDAIEKVLGPLMFGDPDTDPAVDNARKAYAAANLLRQWARNGMPPACECSICKAAGAPAKKGKRK